MDAPPPAVDLSAGWHWSITPDFQQMQPVDWPAVPVARPLWLMCRFDVPPSMTHCLRYHLHMDGLPAGASLTVNRLHLDAVGLSGHLDLDITDHITLHDNTLTVTLVQAGCFTSAWLDFTLCEEL